MKKIINTTKLTKTLIQEFEKNNNVQASFYAALSALKKALYLEECLKGGYYSSVAFNHKNWDNMIDRKHTEFVLKKAKNNLVMALVKLRVIIEFIERDHGFYQEDKVDQVYNEFLQYVDENHINLSMISSSCEKGK